MLVLVLVLVLVLAAQGTAALPMALLLLLDLACPTAPQLVTSQTCKGTPLLLLLLLRPRLWTYCRLTAVWQPRCAAGG